MELTEQDRAEVAARLLDSLEEDEDAEVDSVWTEIERRGRELESGAIAAIPGRISGQDSPAVAVARSSCIDSKGPKMESKTASRFAQCLKVPVKVASAIE